MKIFLTGATGTFGQALIKTYINDHEIVAYSRDELKQARDLPSHPNLTKVLGDVRDYDRTLQAMRGCTHVIHAAAMKRIEACEANPTECQKTNVIGSLNVVRVAKQVGVKALVSLSTDKAVKPVNVYGASKAYMETIVLNHDYQVLRYGNIIGSRGSVVEKWRELKKAGDPIQITDLAATRFFLRIEEAVKLAYDLLKDPEIKLKIPDMKSATLKDLAEAINVQSITKTGMLPFEKLHEDITEDLSSLDAPRFTLQELKEIVK